ncbi:MAG TPA: radical SAM protein, partial [Polyangia bacterium]
GAIRSLRTWEILEQVRLIAAEGEHDVRGVVFMGMGEPFLNYDNVIAAARVLSDPAGFAIAGKAITISTAGVVPMIRRYTREGHKYRLIVSLGAPESAQRLPLMPIERRWPLPELMDAVRAYVQATGDRMTFAYVAIRGVNLSPAHAEALATLLAGLRAKVSLIDVSDETGAYLPPDEDEVGRFRSVLGAAGIPVVRRYSGGKDIGAACGTLSASQQGGQLVALRR